MAFNLVPELLTSSIFLFFEKQLVHFCAFPAARGRYRSDVGTLNVEREINKRLDTQEAWVCTYQRIVDDICKI